MSKTKFGIIGAGAIAHSACASIAAHPEAELVAVADLSAERRDAIKNQYGMKAAYESNDDIIADSDVEAFYIAVPNKFHAPLAKAALAAGKHVLLEKPFALNHGEAQEVAEAAKASNKLFSLGMNQRFVPGIQKAKTLFGQGKLGELYHAKAYWRRRTGIPKLGTWFSNKELAGGGALLDIGVHLLDAALYVLGNFEPECVTGVTYTKFGNRGLGEGGWGNSDKGSGDFTVDDFASAIIKLKGGQSVNLDVAWAMHQHEDSNMDVELFGTDAGVSCFNNKLYKYGEQSGEYQIIQNFQADSTYPHGCRFANFINAIQGTEPLCTTIEQSLAVQAILDGIYQSSQTGQETRIS